MTKVYLDQGVTRRQIIQAYLTMVFSYVGSRVTLNSALGSFLGNREREPRIIFYTCYEKSDLPPTCYGLPSRVQQHALDMFVARLPIVACRIRSYAVLSSSAFDSKTGQSALRRNDTSSGAAFC